MRGGWELRRDEGRGRWTRDLIAHQGEGNHRGSYCGTRQSRFHAKPFQPPKRFRIRSTVLEEAFLFVKKTLPQAATPAERSLFRKWTKCAVEYLEFGCGGSTGSVFTRSFGLRAISFVDSVEVWLVKVQGPIDGYNKALVRGDRSLVPVKMTAHHGDIGEIAAWGNPKSKVPTEKWLNYARVLGVGAGRGGRGTNTTSRRSDF